MSNYVKEGRSYYVNRFTHVEVYAVSAKKWYARRLLSDATPIGPFKTRREAKLAASETLVRG